MIAGQHITVHDWENAHCPPVTESALERYILMVTLLKLSN